MLLHQFAGAVISDELYYTLIAGALVVVIAGLTLTVFIIKKVVSSKKTSNSKKALTNSLILSTIVVFASVMMFFAIPTVIEDAQWKRKQSDCAKKSGYASPDDDNNPNIATFHSQSTYRECLEN